MIYNVSVLEPSSRWSEDLLSVYVTTLQATTKLTNISDTYLSLLSVSILIICPIFIICIMSCALFLSSVLCYIISITVISIGLYYLYNVLSYSVCVCIMCIIVCQCFCISNRAVSGKTCTQEHSQTTNNNDYKQTTDGAFCKQKKFPTPPRPLPIIRKH